MSAGAWHHPGLHGMRTRRCSARLAVLTLAMLTVAADWTRYESPEKDFTVRFPSPPEEEITEQNGVKVHLVSALTEGLAFQVGYSDVRQSVESRQAEQRALTKVQAGFIKGAKGTLISEREKDVGGAAGRQVEISLPDGRVMKANFAVSNGRMYQIFVNAPSGKALASVDSEEFINSFKLANYRPLPNDPDDDPAGRLAELAGRIFAIVVMGGIVYLAVRSFNKSQRSGA